MGLNGVLYEHGTAMGASDWRADAALVLGRAVERRPERASASSVSVPPGGNSVLTFLDIACPDNSLPDVIEPVIAELRRQAQTRRAFAQSGAVSAEFAVNFGEAAPAAAIDELWSAARALLENPQPAAWANTPPLVVRVRHDDERWIFELAQTSVDRVHGAGGQPARVGVPFDVADDLRLMLGRLYPYAAEWVTGLSRDALLPLGGVQFEDETGRILGHWPQR